MNWKAESAAILLAPALYHAWLIAKDETEPLFEGLPVLERDFWIMVSDVVLQCVCDLHQAKGEDDALFQATAELTRKHFAAIRGGKA